MSDIVFYFLRYVSRFLHWNFYCSQVMYGTFTGIIIMLDSNSSFSVGERQVDLYLGTFGGSINDCFC